MSQTILSMPASRVPYTPTGTGGRRRPIAEKVAETVSVTDFGAVGLGTTHPLSGRYGSLAAAQADYPFATSLAQELDYCAFVAACVDVGYVGTVRVPTGDYVFGTDSLVLHGQVNIIGDGIDATTITYAGTGAAIQCGQNGTAGHYQYHISGLTLDGQSVGAVGIRVGCPSGSPLSSNGHYSHLRITGFATAGLRLTAAQICTFDDLWVEENDGDGLWVDATHNQGNVLNAFKSCHFNRNALRGVYVQQFDSLTFDDACEFESNGQEGLLVERPASSAVVCRLIKIFGYLEDNNDAVGRASGFAQLKVYSLGSAISNNVQIRGVRFQGGGASNRQLYLDHCTASVWYPEMVGGGTAEVSSSSVSIVHIWDDGNPATEWTVGASADVRWSIAGSGLSAEYTNVSGTPTAASYAVLSAATNVFSGGMGIGTGATTLKTDFEVASGSGVLSSNLLTDATTKVGRFGTRNYTTASTPFYGILLTSTSTLNLMAIGGGTSIGFAATQIDFYAAADNATLTGTNAWRMLGAAAAAATAFAFVPVTDATYDIGGTSNRLKRAHAGQYNSKVATPTYGTTVAIDGTVRNHKLTVTDTVAFTISGPTNGVNGDQLTLDILNSSGGSMGAITWSSVYLLAGSFTNPASTKRRTISFYRESGFWVETGRAAADI